MRDITREEAVCLFRRQWSDMQRDLGDNPTCYDRVVYKRKWCYLHGYSDVCEQCFLCEWTEQNKTNCDDCPIEWNSGRKNQYGNYCLYGTLDYRFAPISEILALPERKVE